MYLLLNEKKDSTGHMYFHLLQIPWVLSTKNGFTKIDFKNNFREKNSSLTDYEIDSLWLLYSRTQEDTILQLIAIETEKAQDLGKPVKETDYRTYMGHLLQDVIFYISSVMTMTIERNSDFEDGTQQHAFKLASNLEVRHTLEDIQLLLFNFNTLAQAFRRAGGSI